MLSPRRYPISLPDQREGRAQADSGWLHPRGGCGQEPSPQDTLKARVAADFERR
jgi:hypothetical protein